MKFVEQLRVWGRAERRRLADQVRGRGLPVPGSSFPARLDLLLDDLGTPTPAPGDAPLEVWEARIVSWVMASGPLPVRIVGHATHPLLAELARFAWRLECPGQVRTTARGLDTTLANALIDAGVKRVTLVDDGGVHLGAAGDASALEAALHALSAARASRAVKVDLVVELPFPTLLVAGSPDLAATSARLRAAGADGLEVGAPWQGGPWGADGQEVLSRSRAWVASFHRTAPSTWHILSRYDGAGPGAPRAHGRCPVAGLRLALGPDGMVCSCPFQQGAVTLGEDAAAVLRALADHRSRIHACERTCVHAVLTA